MRSTYLIGGLALAAALILGLTYYLRQSGETPEREAAPAPVVDTETAPEATGEPAERMMEETPPSPLITEPEVVLPALNDSDDFIRARLPETLPEAWVSKDDLLRRLAVVVENARRGELPRRQLGFLAPEGAFQVREEPGDTPDEAKLYVDPASYRRYDPYVDALESIPPATMAGLVQDTYPLLQEAMQELGTQDQVLPQMLTAIDEVLAVPVLQGDVALVQPKVLYEYADPALESLTPLQKQVLRMGPQNVARVQAYLKALRKSLVAG